jgi:hypothetical protein
MGHQARLRAQRRAELNGPRPINHGLAGQILRGIHKDLCNACGESPRRCWEYLVEMMAHASGWDTETNESGHLWQKIPNHERFLRFAEAWNEEVLAARDQGTSFSEPLGDLLQEIEGTNKNLGQHFTPMNIVRAMNAMSFADMPELKDNGQVPVGLDPCCATGRFILDALVHHKTVMMRGVDLDLWLLRAAMVNIRYLAKFTTLRLKDESEIPLFDKVSAASLENRGVDFTRPSPGIAILGGRAMFMHGNSLVVDLNFPPNWLCGGWAWTPMPWEHNLKIAPEFNFNGSWAEYEAQQESKNQRQLESKEHGERFDFSMDDQRECVMVGRRRPP